MSVIDAFRSGDFKNLRGYRGDLVARNLAVLDWREQFGSEKFDANLISQKLITPTPDLSSLREWTLEKLGAQPRRWKDLQAELRPELRREPQLNDVVRELRKQGSITATDYKGMFSAKANPLLQLAARTDV